MAHVETLFNVGDVIAIPVEGGRWNRLISNKRPTYIKGKTYFAKAKIYQIQCYLDINNNVANVHNYLHYLDEEEDCYFLHMLTDKQLTKDNVQKVENYGTIL